MPRYATPPHVRVHYRIDGTTTASMTGYVHANQYDGGITLVLNPAAANDPHVCCWQMRTDRVTRIEVLDPGIPEPSVMEQILAATTLTARQRLVYDAVLDAGGPLQWTDVGDIDGLVNSGLGSREIADALQALKAQGRITLTHSADASSGVVTVN